MTEGVTATAKLVSVVSLIHRVELAKAICSMSTATLEIPASSTQLYFTWNDEVEATIDMTCRSAAAAAMAGGTCQETTLVASDAAIASTSSPAFADESQRHAQPMKIGSLLLQLLKRYGITDDEIAAGIAAYEERKLKMANV